MHASIQILKNKHKLPFDEVISVDNGERFTSVVRIMQLIGEWQLAEDQYKQELGELLPGVAIPASFDHPKMAQYVFRYVVQNLAIAHRDNSDIDLSAILQKSTMQARKWITENSWIFAADEQPKLDANGNIAPPKGAKRILARRVYDEHKEEGKQWTRKEWIKLLVEKVGLTESGASTYYHNLKKGIY